MLIAKIDNPVPMDYREAFPNTSFPPSGPSDEFLASEGYAKVNAFKEHDRATQKLVPVEPYYEAPWIYTVAVADKTPEEIEAERKTKVPQVVTPRQAKLALLQAELLDDIELAVSQADRATQIEWEYATEFKRTWPTLLAMQTALGLTDQQLDDLFTLAATL